MNINDLSDKCVSCSGCRCSHCGGNGGGKLDTFDYLSDIPVVTDEETEPFVEVQFKNTRKGFYLNNLNYPLKKGDVVAVEANPGHDIGTVSLTGRLVQLQMRHKHYKSSAPPLKIFRIAKPNDLERYEEAKSREQRTMIRSRQIAKDLGLDMKIGDVEYQGDGMKAIFYYIADKRVDFRQLIRELANEFRVRVEMRQIGARQEAGRIGGIGPCGRQLCCSGWMTDFVSVSTNAARIQDISLNPQKLAGQCAKLKCCLNYEVHTYYEAQGLLPDKNVELHTSTGTYRLYKADILAQQITYVPVGVPVSMDDAITISTDRAKQIIATNNEGKEPYSLLSDTEAQQPQSRLKMPKDILNDSSLTRFDTNTKKRKNKRESRSKAKVNTQNQINGAPHDKQKEEERIREKVMKEASERGKQRTQNKSNRRRKRHSGKKPVSISSED